MYEEEVDVTEIYFILKGDWAIAFNSYFRMNDCQLVQTMHDDELKGPEDMWNLGYLIAQKKQSFGYIGDYYVLSSKRSQFFYVALSQMETYALTKHFMFNVIFQKFPGLQQEMLSTSFSRYLKEFRKPCDQRRKDVLEKLN